MVNQPDDDFITLGGQKFPIQGMAQGNAASEFETGIKVGKVGYDARTNAFYMVMDDFSGGMGYRRTDLRDQASLATFWDYPEDGYAADTRRPGHITLGPKRTDTYPEHPTMAPSNSDIHPSVPYTTDGSCWLFGFGSGLYHTSDGITFLKSYDNTNGVCTAVVPFPGGYMGIIAKYFAIFHLGNIPYATNGSSICAGAWTPGRTIQSYQDPPPGPPIVNIVSNPGNQPAGSSPGVLQSPLPSAGAGSGATRVQYVVNYLTDGIFWDQKIVVGAYNQGLLFGIVTPSDGSEHWNIEDQNDNNFVGVPLIGSNRQIHMVGIESATWGEPAIYFLAGGPTGADLWVMDFYSRKVYPIKIGLETKLYDGKIWQAKIVLTDGRNVFSYDPGRDVSNIGLPRRDGSPPSLVQPTGQEILLEYLLPTDAYLFAVGRAQQVSSTAADYSQLFCYNGKGWHRIGSNIPSSLAHYCAVADYGSTIGRKLHVFGTRSTVANGMVVSSYGLPNLSHIPVYGVSHFEDHGGLITGWIDGGFSDISGAMLKVSIDALHLSTTETVKVEYQLDNDEASGWLATYDVAGLAAVFDSANRTLYFSGLAGKQFRTVRFRLTLYRGTDETKTPEVRAIVFTYLKKPPFRSSWNFTVDVDRMLEVPSFYTIDGQNATLARIWTKLQSLWNTQTLHALTIPSLTGSDLYVSITDAPLSFDDFRTQIGGNQGQINLRVLEPISAST